MEGNPEQESRIPLDRDRIVRVALELLDEVGLDDLSMRRLAERLNVTAASLYWYVHDKSELLALLADAISAEIAFPDPRSSWRSALESSALSLRKVTQAHRDAARVLATTMPTGPHRLRAIDALLGLLIRAGFPSADAADIAYMLNAYSVGFMLDQALGTQPSRPGSATAVGISSGTPAILPAHGHLVFPTGAANLTLRADASLSTLYEMTFSGRSPTVQVQADTVQISLRRDRRSSCEVTLAGTVSWDISVEGGALRLAADLRDLSLSSVHIAGGVSQAMVQLPKPSGTIAVTIDGGVDRLHVERPYSSAIRLQLHRDSNHVSIDGLHLGAVGGRMEWESPDYASASDRYNLQIRSGANELSLSAIPIDTVATADPKNTGQNPIPDWFTGQPADKYPNLHALSSYLANLDLNRCFEIGLQILLDGLERRLAATSGSNSPFE